MWVPTPEYRSAEVQFDFTYEGGRHAGVLTVVHSQRNRVQVYTVYRELVGKHDDLHQVKKGETRQRIITAQAGQVEVLSLSLLCVVTRWCARRACLSLQKPGPGALITPENSHVICAYGGGGGVGRLGALSRHWLGGKPEPKRCQA